MWLTASSSHQRRGVRMILLSLLMFARIGTSTASYPIDDFVPFGAIEGDTLLENTDDGNSGAQYLNVSFHFFGKEQTVLYVNANGDITFENSYFNRNPNQIQDVLLAIIAPFWSDVDLRDDGGVIYFRQTRAYGDLKIITADIRRATTSDEFTATWAFVATWLEVEFYGANSEGELLRNTFQQVLAFDENTNTSYAYMNYNTLVWTSGTTSNASPSTGTGGRPADAGFNAGDGEHFFMLPGSQTEDVVRLAENSNVGVAGQWVFLISGDRIDGEPIVCNDVLDLVFVMDKSGSIKNHQWHVEKRIVRELIDKFQVSAGKVHVALNLFAANVKPKWCFDRYTTREELNEAVDGLFCSHCHSGFTGLGKALRYTAARTLTAECGVRDNSVAKAVVVLTDGKSHEKETEHTWEQSAHHLKHLPNVTVVAVGVGWYDEVLLQQIASDPSLVFTAHNFDELLNRLRPIARAACPPDPPVKTCLDGWYFDPVSQNCFKWFDELVSRVDVWQRCFSNDAVSVNIQKEATNTFLKAISLNKKIWLDLWKVESDWFWNTSPYELRWTNWATQSHPRGECVLMEARNSRKWRVVKCDNHVATYICSMERLT